MSDRLEDGSNGGRTTAEGPMTVETPETPPNEPVPVSPGPGRRVKLAIAAGTAFLMVGHRSVYASQKIGLSKSAGLDVALDVPIGELTRSGLKIRHGSLTERVLRRQRQIRSEGPGTPET